MEYKIELLRLEKKQTDLIKALAEKGIKCSEPQMSAALKGLVTPKYDMIRKEVEIILTEWKENQN